MFGLVRRGLRDKQIAERLVISVKTVEKHVGAVLRKTGARNRTELAGAGGNPHPRTGSFPDAGAGPARLASEPPTEGGSPMPVVPTGEILSAAYRERYGVAAINIVNDLTLEAVLAAATEQRAPLIVQTSVKTVRSIGYDVLYGMWTTMTADVPVPVALHLDHCPDRDVISRCLRGRLELGALRRLPRCRSRRTSGRRSRSSPRPSSTAPRSRVRSSPSPGSRTASAPTRRPPARTSRTWSRFIETTGVDVFAPAIGNAHGVYSRTPTLDAQRVSDIVAARRHPDGPARRHRDERRPVHRPHRAAAAPRSTSRRRSRSRT